MLKINLCRLLGLLLICSLSLIATENVVAQGKRSAGHAGGMGGGRPGGGHAGGAMSRPSPGAMSRPSPGGGNAGGAMSRPNPSAMNRPNPGMTRPAPGMSGAGLPQARPNLPSGNSGIGGMSGMSRPSPGVGNSRPPVAQLPMTRPSPSNPNLPTTRPTPSTRPNTLPGNLDRPMPGTRPTPGTRPAPETRPTPGNRPNNLPSTFPGNNTRPAPGTIDRPTTRPTPGGTVRPTFPSDNANRPTTKPAPGAGGTVRPTFPNRPTTLPGDLGNGGIDNRPTTRPVERPGVGNRPTTLPGDLSRPTNRPSTLPGQIGGNRPVRPGTNDSGFLPNRPTTLPGDLTKPAPGFNRPVTLPGQIGGNGNNWWNDNNGNWGNGNWNNGNWNNGNWNNNNFWNNTNNNTWNNWVQNNQNNWNVNVNNNYWGVGNNWYRPNGGLGYYNNWGYNNGVYFGDYWCGNYVRPWHNNWYHGCWNDSWCNNWYVPLATGLTGWALGASTSNWGYSYSYSNPYYVASAQPVYNYSQPIVIYSDTSSAVTQPAAQAAGGQAAAPPPQPTSAEQTAQKDFELAQKVFKEGDYTQALVGVESALRLVPKDPVMHEFRALCLFAVGEYQSAAAVLNSLLATAPGMDWTTMSSLYSDVDDYTKQLRRLEDHIRQKPEDAAANFVVAYHYLVLDDKDSAIDALQAVVKAQPNDLTASRLLATLSPPAPPKAAVAEKLPEGKSETGADAPEEVAAPTTNLVGNWTAKNDQTSIELTVSEDMKFVWKASMNGQSSELQGKLETTENSLAFETEKQGNLVGQAVSQGPDKFQFILLGAPVDDQGLTFERKK